jgi:hypothetical protein
MHIVGHTAGADDTDADAATSDRHPIRPLPPTAT